jgi:hypothetical protein
VIDNLKVLFTRAALLKYLDFVNEHGEYFFDSGAVDELSAHFRSEAEALEVISCKVVK